MTMMMLTTMGATVIFYNIFLIISLQKVNTLESGKYKYSICSILTL